MNKKMQRLDYLIGKTDNINNINIKQNNKPLISDKYEKDDKITQLIKQTENIHNNTHIYEHDKTTDIFTIKQKYDNLDSYEYMPESKYEKELIIGKTIRYYFNNKLSISGLITMIDYFDGVNLKHIQTLHLFNRWSKTSWKITIVSKKYIIFVKKYRLSKAQKIVRQLQRDENE
jgi:hypothetical protein